MRCAAARISAADLAAALRFNISNASRRGLRFGARAAWFIALNAFVRLPRAALLRTALRFLRHHRAHPYRAFYAELSIPLARRWRTRGFAPLIFAFGSRTSRDISAHRDVTTAHIVRLRALVRANAPVAITLYLAGSRGHACRATISLRVLPAACAAYAAAAARL